MDRRGSPTALRRLRIRLACAAALVIGLLLAPVARAAPPPEELRDADQLVELALRGDAKGVHALIESGRRIGGFELVERYDAVVADGKWSERERYRAIALLVRESCTAFRTSGSLNAAELCIESYEYITKTYNKLESVEDRKDALSLLGDVAAQLVGDDPQQISITDPSIYLHLGNAAFAALDVFVTAAGSSDAGERLSATRGLERLARALHAAIRVLSPVTGDGILAESARTMLLADPRRRQDFQEYLLSLSGNDLDSAHELVEAFSVLLSDNSPIQREAALATMSAIVPLALFYVEIYMGHTDIRDMPGLRPQYYKPVGDANLATARIYSASIEAILQIARAKQTALADELLRDHGKAASLAMFDALGQLQSGTNVHPTVRSQHFRMHTDLLHEIEAAAANLARLEWTAEHGAGDPKQARRVASLVVQHAAKAIPSARDLTTIRALFDVIDATESAGLDGYAALADALDGFHTRTPAVQQEIANNFERLFEPDRFESDERPRTNALREVDAAIISAVAEASDPVAREALERANAGLTEVVDRREKLFDKLKYQWKKAGTLIKSIGRVVGVGGGLLSLTLLVIFVIWLVKPVWLAGAALIDPSRNRAPKLQALVDYLNVLRFFGGTERVILAWFDHNFHVLSKAFFDDESVKGRLENYEPLVRHDEAEQWLAELLRMQQTRRSIGDAPRLALIGNAGSGKSSLAFDLIYRGGRNCSPDRAFAGQPVLGVLLRDDDISHERNGAWLRELIARRLTVGHARPPKRWVDKLARRGRLALVVDGVSEFKQPIHPNSELDHKWLPTIFTSRTPVKVGVSLELTLGPLSEDQFRTLVAKLVEASRSPADTVHGPMGPKDLVTLDRWIANKHKRLRRPIFSKLIADQFARSGIVPDGTQGECELYLSYVERQLQSVKELATAGVVGLDLVAVVAYSMLRDRKWAPSWVSGQLPVFGLGEKLLLLEAKGVSIDPSATLIVERLIAPSGLLIRRDGGNLRFAEDPIAECMAAYHIFSVEQTPPGMTTTVREYVTQPSEDTEVHRYLGLWRGGDVEFEHDLVSMGGRQAQGGQLATQ